MIYPSLREVKMQKFSYHTHTNSFGLFDGRNTVEEMIEGAYRAGYTELGISNHLIYHPNMHISSEAQKKSDAPEFLSIYGCILCTKRIHP